MRKGNHKLVPQTHVRTLSRTEPATGFKLGGDSGEPLGALTEEELLQDSSSSGFICASANGFLIFLVGLLDGGVKVTRAVTTLLLQTTQVPCVFSVLTHIVKSLCFSSASNLNAIYFSRGAERLGIGILEMVPSDLLL